MISRIWMYHATTWNPMKPTSQSTSNTRKIVQSIVCFSLPQSLATLYFGAFAWKWVAVSSKIKSLGLPMRIAIQGELGSFSHQAALQMEPQATVVPCALSAEVFKLVEDG